MRLSARDAVTGVLRFLLQGQVNIVYLMSKATFYITDNEVVNIIGINCKKDNKSIDILIEFII